MIDCRLIIDPPTSGVRNMSVDEALLLDAAEHGVATLRFYSWSEPTLSLGYFQNYSDREQHAASRGCAVVRRQTGGGAILHDRELTYSVALPPTHPLTRQNEELYQIVHRVFVETLSPADQLSNSDTPLRIRGEVTKLPASDEPFLCFLRQSPGDVVFLAQPSGEGNVNLSQTAPSPVSRKILGSAQRRHRGAVLQHGSLLWERSPAAPELAGWADLASPDLAAESVISSVAARLGDSLGLRLQKANLPLEMESIIAGIANNKYGSPDWTKRR